MPELPEVEVARRQLVRWLGEAPLLSPRVPEPTTVRSRRSTSPAAAHPEGAGAVRWLAGRRLTATDRVGKRLLLRFADRAVTVHLGMTGWLACRASEVPAPRHARFGWAVEGRVVWLVDVRRFGCVVPDEADWTEGLGPDARDAGLRGEDLAARCRSRRAVKAALMDQSRLAGLGNIQVAEVLYEAGLDPRTPCDAIPPAGWTRLAAALPRVLDRALAATDTDGDVAYVTQGGSNPFRVYGRDDRPCPRCGGAVTSFRQQGRTTWVCPGCQVDPRDEAGAPR